MIYKSIPSIKEYIWAGSKLKNKYNKITDLNKISETWELSINESGLSSLLIDNKEVLLKDYIISHNIGSNIKSSDFKMLVKLIDSDDFLSIQVHPSDEYALKKYNKLGKTEMWYIIDAEEDSYLYLGFNEDYQKEEVEKALYDGSILEMLNKVPVKPGDFYIIPSGTIHAIGKGITLYEIQENSDLTFRLYDYDRVDKNGNKRELHINEALDVLNYNKYDVSKNTREKKQNVLCANDYFELLKVKTVNEYEFVNNNSSFEFLTIINGNPTINGIETKTLESYFVEPNTKLEIKGDSSLLIARYPQFSVGLDVGGTAVKGLIIDDFNNKIVEDKKNTGNVGLDKIVESMCECFNSLIDKACINPGFIKKLGVGFPASIKDGTNIIGAENLGIDNVNLKSILEDKLNLEVILENDANCAVLGEYYFTKNRRYHDIALITLGTGVGSGLIINSNLFRGGNGTMVELGHMKVKNDNIRCSCGQYGCLESLLGMNRIRLEVDKLKNSHITKLSEIIKDTDSPIKIFSLYDENIFAKEFVDKYLNTLLSGLINIANLLEPEVILIGGGVSYHISKFIPQLEYRLNKFKYNSLKAPKIKLYQAILGNDAGAYGACYLTRIN